MPTFQTILYQVEETTATLTLNRPKSLNALSAQMADEIVEALALARADEHVRALVLTGAGGNFCAGGDVKSTEAAGPRTEEQARAGMERYRVLTEALWDFDRPVIAAADGVAFGAGFSLLLLADIVLLSQSARLCMAFGRIGLVPDCGALFTLPRTVGLQRAKELVFSAREIDADAACDMGIALEILTADKLLPRAMVIARSFAGASSTALALAKQALNSSQHSDLNTMMAIEASGQAALIAGPYLVESARRFAAKAAPRFQWVKNTSA